MSMITEGARALAHILSEASGTRSRDIVTIVSGQGKLEPGSVLGKVTASGKYAVSPNAEVVGIEGAETATCILAYAVDATDADVEAVVTARDAEVKSQQLTFHASVNDATKTGAKHTQLALAGIIAR